MITFEEALKIVLSSSREMPVERVDLSDSLGRFLAEDVISDMDMPPFNKSAMDGFACKRGDNSDNFKVVETIAAGCLPARKISDGECARIMTGAMIPEGADTVVRIEDTEATGENTIRINFFEKGDNIARRGEDIKIGDRVLTKGVRIAPEHIAVLASVGYTRPAVFIRPRIGIFSTGDEIVEPGIKPGLTQIRNSNGYQLAAQVTRAGALAEYRGLIPDDETLTFDAIFKAIDENDIVILSGGVSLGTFDFLPRVFERLGVEIRFRTIAMQPGKPTVFGTVGKKFIFGLPGNPVSSYNTFELLVRPFLSKMMGQEYCSGFLQLPMGEIYRRRKSDRLSWIPVSIREGKVYPLDYHGSAHILSLTRADGIGAVPINTTELKTGEIINVRQI